MGIRYSALPGHTQELSDVLNKVLSDKWDNLRGIRIVSLGVSSVKASEEDEAMIKNCRGMLFSAILRWRQPRWWVHRRVAMQSAASNQKTGPAMAFAAMNMGQMSVERMHRIYLRLGQQQATPQMQPQYQQPSQTAPKTEWTCACGAVNTGKFCSECGSPRPADHGPAAVEL